MQQSNLYWPKLHPKQEMAFRTTANELLYGGATRGGKSHLVRIAFAIWSSRIPGFQCDIFRLNCDDVVADCMEGHFGFRELLAPWEKDGIVKINEMEVKFWNGSQISLEHASNPLKVKLKHQGIARHARAFVEATQIQKSLIQWLRAWVTMPEDMKDKLPEQLKDLYPELTPQQLRDFFPKIIYASNPRGVSAGYFRRNFVIARKAYSISQAPENEGGFMRQYIPAKVEDNPSENAEATCRRVKGMGDEAMSKALLEGDWEAPTGDFFKQYDDDIHTCPDFQPPDHWFKYRTFDWGSSDPFCVHWWCVSDGVEFQYAGSKMWFPRGCLICYREWYGCDPEDQSKGLMMRNEDVAKGIIERTKEVVFPAVITDSLPFQDRGFSHNGKMYKICDEFLEHGVRLIQGNCARVYGWKQVRDRLIGKDGFPMIRFCQSATYVREYIPALQYHPNPDKREDAQESGEATHSCDSTRLAASTRPLIIDAPKKAILVKGFQHKTPKEILEQMRLA